MSSPTAPESNSAQLTSPQKSQLDYVKLVTFLCSPFLDSQNSLRIDCEQSSRTNRILIRLAIEGEDKGRVFGRGGRNLQAIRTVLKAVAELNGQVANLEVFGNSASGDRPPDSDSRSSLSSNNRRRPSRPPRRPKDVQN